MFPSGEPRSSGTSRTYSIAKNSVTYRRGFRPPTRYAAFTIACPSEFIKLAIFSNTEMVLGLRDCMIALEEGYYEDQQI
jgi:hypothetical protein